MTERGHYPETVAQSVGIDEATYRNWMKWGADGREPYGDFFRAVACARAKAEITLGEQVLEGDGKGEGFGAAKAAAFMLERTRSRRFAQRINVKVQDELERMLDVVQGICSSADLNRILEELARRDSAEAAASAAGEEPEPIH